MKRFAVLMTLVGAFAGCAKYDELVEKDAVADQRWADIEAQLQRRHDLVPNLVATVKGSAKHEQETLEKVIQARSQAAGVHLTAEDLEDPEKMARFQAAEDQLSGALSRLMVVQEQYPDLKANAAFRDLQAQLEGTENRILRARELYNEAVRDYNAELGKLRGKIVNRVSGRPFKPRVYFNASAAAREAPQVQL